MATNFALSSLVQANQVLLQYKLRAKELIKEELSENLEFGRILDIGVNENNNIFVHFTYRENSIFADYSPTYWEFTLEEFNE